MFDSPSIFNTKCLRGRIISFVFSAADPLVSVRLSNPCRRLFFLTLVTFSFAGPGRRLKNMKLHISELKAAGFEPYQVLAISFLPYFSNTGLIYPISRISICTRALAMTAPAAKKRLVHHLDTPFSTSSWYVTASPVDHGL